MSFRATALKRSQLVVFLLGLGSLSVFAQAPTSPIAFSDRDAIVTSLVHAPNLGTLGASSDDTQWLKIEFHYGTTPVLTTNYIDAVEFKVWVEGRDLLDPQGKPGEGIAVGFTGSVTYINIPKGKDLYGVFYVNPSTLGRYSTDRGLEDYDRKFDVHIEAYIGGALMDKIDKKKGETDGWHLLLKAIPDLVYRQDQCPFLVMDPDRYPAIKLPPSQSK